MRLAKIFFPALFLFALNSSELWAQTATGSILGTVKDSSGSVVSGVAVTVTSPATGVTRTTATGEAGTYSVVALLPGNYLLTYEATGFAKGAQSLTVTVGATTNGDFVMPWLRR